MCLNVGQGPRHIGVGGTSATCSKVARDVCMLMADEIEEVCELQGDDVVGSSTMPNKVNSKVAVQVIALAARLRAMAPLALEAMQPTHEGDAANNQMIYAVIEQGPASRSPRRA